MRPIFRLPGDDDLAIWLAKPGDVLPDGTIATPIVTPLDDAQPFEYAGIRPVGDVQELTARGVSDAHEAECFARYERDMDECTAYRSAMGGQRFMDSCAQRAFQHYQQCRGY